MAYSWSAAHCVQNNLSVDAVVSHVSRPCPKRFGPDLWYPLDFFRERITMEIMSRNCRRLVLITSTAREFITISENCGLAVIETADIRSELQRIVEREDNSCRIHAVIFLHFTEYPHVKPLLSAPDFSQVACQLIAFGSTEHMADLEFISLSGLSEFRSSPLSEKEFLFIVRKAFAVLQALSVNRSMQERYLARLIDTKKDQEDLINIGRALSTEKNPENLLRLILNLSKRMTGADAGSIYLVETGQDGVKRLLFKCADTFSRNIRLEEFVLPMNKKSIAGYVAVTGQVLNLKDAYNLPPDAPYSYNPAFDNQYGYQSRSMLVVPMRNHLDEIIGVIQLINCKESEAGLAGHGDIAFSVLLDKPEDFTTLVVPFHHRYDSLLEAVAGQAAIAIENNRMILQIQHQFEEFVKASVAAIESRDPATSGHSFRVAAFCTAMARAVNEAHTGTLKDARFSEVDIKELELAALLHDFGKVYIDIAVFMKAKKLPPKDFDNLCLRLDYLYRFLEVRYATREAALLKSQAADATIAESLERLHQERALSLERVRHFKQQLIRLNEPSVLEENPEVTLAGIKAEIQTLDCLGLEGERIEALSPQDVLNLSVRRGNLNPLERQEIESHVRHTHGFVSKIPWPPEYANIPEIALQHHEKLDGSGYPEGRQGPAGILLQSRIMAVADIFDALTAADRPYKKAVPLEKALAILTQEAERGAIDKELVELFIARKLYALDA